MRSTSPDFPRIQRNKIPWLAAGLAYLVLLIACGNGTSTLPPGGGKGGNGGGGTPNNVVLMSGGQRLSGGAPTASAAVYDINSNAISATGSMFNARAYFTLTSLGNKMELAAGGNTTAAANSAEIFSLSAGTFRPTASMHCSHAYHSATLLNGRVLVAGGSSSRCAELFDPATGTWTPTGTMTAVRFGATANLLSNGLVLITGGANAATGGTPTSSAELYNPATGVFSATGSMVSPRAFHAAIVLANNDVLVSGGEDASGISNTAEVYDPTAGTFTVIATMTQARAQHTATLLQDGTVLLAGGLISTSGVLTNTAEIYNPNTETFTVTSGVMAVARAGNAAVILRNGSVLIVGGSGGSSGVASAETFNPTTQQFSASGSFNPPGVGVAAAALQ